MFKSYKNKLFAKKNKYSKSKSEDVIQALNKQSFGNTVLSCNFCLKHGVSINGRIHRIKSLGLTCKKFSFRGFIGPRPYILGTSLI
ncbi:hypothetical protein VIGAN_02196300, partial [Vigna angularis var. angularis]